MVSTQSTGIDIMKFIVFSSKQIFILLSFLLIILSGNISSVLSKKIQNDISYLDKSSVESSRTKKHRIHAAFGNPVEAKPIQKNFTNTSYNVSMRTQMETIFNYSGLTYRDSNQFFHDHNSFLANKLLDKQIIEIYNIFRTKKYFTSRYDLRSGIEFFLNDFEACSPDKTYVMDFAQFSKCMSTDPSLKRIIPTPAQYASFNGYSDPKDTNSTEFKKLVFKSINKMNENYINFYDYLMLRLFVFSWWKCSVNGPYLDETGFECAIDIVNDWRSMDRQTSRNIYYIAIKLSPNAEKTRHIDFINFIYLATSIRTYGSINQKEDSDATKAEFNNALDNNILPIRYNQKIIDDFFKLVSDDDNSDQGIDIQSFWYFDSILRIFFDENSGEKRWMANFDRFTKILNSKFMPEQYIRYIKLIPQYSLTNSSYHLEAFNNPHFFDSEEKYLMTPKFLEKSSKLVSIKNNSQIIKNYNETETYGRLFKILDADEDGYINFYDFGTMIQVFTMFAETDTHNKGRVVAGVLLEKFSQETDRFITLSRKFRENAKRFGIINQDTYFDVYHALLLMKIDEIAFHYARNEDPTLLFEIELKQILLRTGMINIPDGKLSGCIRSTNENAVKKYDWECAIMTSLRYTLDYIERINDLIKMKDNKINLAMTAYANVDPSLKPPKYQKPYENLS